MREIFTVVLVEAWRGTQETASLELLIAAQLQIILMSSGRLRNWWLSGFEQKNG